MKAVATKEVAVTLVLTVGEARILMGMIDGHGAEPDVSPSDEAVAWAIKWRCWMRLIG